ncbi:Rab geranylgeranyltransferase [Saxophila tyrrhenica]|uniref:Geranylgeranyl transferase type-2 subunit beta n=1 Tax=Saxophila tyrrhenica TaxID=1690608 RepID=A0AAV9PI26_9PEZI|nr:Rab geranylgeranyltransferase [Saxophila tyrrhenica]
MSLAAGPGRAGTISDQLPDELRLVVDKHVSYIQSLDTRRDELEYHLTEHLRISGIYWGLTALHLLHHPSALPREGIVAFVLSCLHPNDGFGAAPGHDAHMLYTVSAVQILAMTDGFAELEDSVPNGKRKVAEYIAGLQQPNGTFAGDDWGETDTRFLYGALNALSLLNMLPSQRPNEPPLIDIKAATDHVKSCLNHDGGFGVSPGAESHAGQIFTCLGALSITGELDSFLGESGKDRLGAWLSERQLDDSGGFNGRPMKLVDVCYSWWVGSSLAMIGKLDWIDRERLKGFILRCQDAEEGGMADRPGDMVDVFHTCFGVAGLSLLGCEGVGAVDAA